MRKGNYHQVFGARCNQSDVIGVGIDIEAKVRELVPRRPVSLGLAHAQTLLH